MKYELDHTDIRDSVSRLCTQFPGEYWRRCDREQAYPSEFVQALTDAGFLSALIPEQYGGPGLPMSAACAILEEIHRRCAQQRALKAISTSSTDKRSGPHAPNTPI